MHVAWFIADVTDLISKQCCQAGSRKHSGQNLLLLHSLLCLGSPQSLLENPCQIAPSGCLGLEIAVRPIMQQASKPANTHS